MSINEKTAEIKLNKYPDYESKFLINGVYYMTILGITNGKLAKDGSSHVAGLSRMCNIQPSDTDDRIRQL